MDSIFSYFVTDMVYKKKNWLKKVKLYNSYIFFFFNNSANQNEMYTCYNDKNLTS